MSMLTIFAGQQKHRPDSLALSQPLHHGPCLGTL